MYATVGGQLEILILLLEAGANINEQSDSGDTALIKAVLCNHFDVANLLLINNANVDIIDNEGWTALSIAIARGNNKFIKLLTQHKTKTKIRK
jgi:ankyrin repeat protein